MFVECVSDGCHGHVIMDIRFMMGKIIVNHKKETTNKKLVHLPTITRGLVADFAPSFKPSVISGIGGPTTDTHDTFTVKVTRSNTTKTYN